MRKLFVIAALLLSSSLFAKEDINSYWQKANKAYEQKDYENAVTYYEKIATTKPNEAVVYFNLGNAYYKLNQIGPAILNYERTLRLQPGNKQAQDNLSIAQSRIINHIPIAEDIFFIKWAQTITSPGNAGMWSVTSLLLFLLLLGTAIYSKAKRTAPLLPVRLRVSLWSALVLFLIFGFVSASHKVSHNKAVVMQKDTPFYTSPQQTKPAVYVPEGTTVKCSNNVQEWTEVTLPDGRQGWIHTESIVRI